MEFYVITATSGITLKHVAMCVRAKYNEQLRVSCSSHKALIHDNITTEQVNSKVVGKLLEEILALHATVSARKSRIIQDIHI
jgi:hypothetical protein